MNNSGQSLVEFAVSFMVIVFLLSGTVEFGIAFFQFIQLRDAAQEGSLFGSVCSNHELAEERARNASNKPLDLTSPDVIVTVEYVEGGDAVKTTMQYDHKIFMPFVPVFIGSDFIHLKATVTDTVLSRDYC